MAMIYLNIFDSKGGNVGKYPLIEIGIFLCCKEDYSSDMWYIQ